jgi:uncharacterized protein
MRGGFSDDRWDEIARTVFSVLPFERIMVFGSRAKGVWREGSDIDIAVWGPLWNALQAERARELLEERFFPWSFDVTLPDKIENRDIADHIDRVGFEIGNPRHLQG